MIRLLAISLFFTCTAAGQDAFFRFEPPKPQPRLLQQVLDHTKRNAWTYPALLGSGFLNGAMDVHAQKHSSSVWADTDPASFWGRESWRRKWAWNDEGQKQGERFLGSSTFLVWTTDGWHLSKSVSITLIQSVSVFRKGSNNFWINALDLLLYKALYSAGWHIANNLLIEKS